MIAGGGARSATDLRQSRLYSEDLAPVPAGGRKWGTASFAALWISLAACIPTYMLASSLIGGGMSWWQAVLTIFLGNLIVLVPMILNAHAGTKYGIPFPVYCRASFGTWGANVPALLRALVACGWFGIQTWIGGNAIYKIAGLFQPSLASGDPLPVLGITGMQLACFLLFWGANMWVIYRGIDTIRFLLNTHWHGDHTGGNEAHGQAGVPLGEVAVDRWRRGVGDADHIQSGRGQGND